MAILFGSLLDDILTGTSAADIHFGMDGDDGLFGLEGDDLLFGGNGHDFLDGGGGNDVLWGGGGHDSIDGGTGSDFLLGGEGNDILAGGAGADTLLGGSGDDVYETAFGGGNDTLIDSAGADTLLIEGNPLALDEVRRAGNDLVMRLDDGSETRVVGHYSGNTLEEIAFPSTGFAVIPTTFAIAGGLTGTTDAGNHNEIFVGTDAAETIDAGDGADWLFGHGGNDTLLGGAGDDYIEGGAEADFIDGGSQDTLAFGGDFAVYAHSDAAVSIDLGAGTASGGHATGDILVNIEGVIGSEFNDVLIGRDGAGDRFMGRGGDDFIDGKSGFDLVDYVESPNGVTVDLTSGTASDGWGGTDTLIGIERVHGSQFDDTLIGTDTTLVVEFFRGRAGNDSIDGRGGLDLADYSIAGGAVDVNLATGVAHDGLGGTDTLANIEQIRASAFNDVLTGDGANNVFQGLSGGDFIDGGDGAFDVADYSVDASFGGTAGVTVNLATGTAIDGFGDTDTLANIESVVGTIFNDVLIGDANANSLSAGPGNDILDGGGAGDFLIGFAGDDTYVLRFGEGNDTIIDAGGNDTLQLFGGSRGPGATLDDAQRSGNDLIIRLDDGSEARIVGHYAGSALETVEFPAFSAHPIFAASSTFAIASGFTGNIGAGEHNEIFVGTDGGELIDAGDGTDFVFGHGGDDTLLGGAGDDLIEGGAGVDFIDGGPQDGFSFGVDFASYAHSDAPVSINLGTGEFSGGHAEGDFLVNIEGIIGSDFDDTLIGRDFADDRFVGRAGFDSIDGLSGFDQVEYGDSPNGVLVDLDLGFAQDGWGGIDTLASIEGVRGSTFDDTLIGSDDPFVFERFRGRAGDDTISGGLGVDEVEYLSAMAGVTVDLASGFATDGEGGSDTLSGIEFIRASFFDDTLTGDGNGNRFQALSGDDYIDGGAGAGDFVDYFVEAFLGGTAGVSVNLAAGTAIDSFGDTDTLVDIEDVFGTNFADTLIGDGGANFLSGQGGNDIIDGGGGNDVLSGGGGDDLFAFEDGWGDDLVTDFSAGSGSPDRLDLSAFGFADFDAVIAAANDVGGNLVIQLDIDDSVTLLGVQEAQLHPDDFFLI